MQLAGKNPGDADRTSRIPQARIGKGVRGPMRATTIYRRMSLFGAAFGDASSLPTRGHAAVSSVELADERSRLAGVQA